MPIEMRHRLAVVRGLVALHRDDAAAMAKLAPELGEAARRDDRTGLLLFELARAALRDRDTARGRSWLFDLLATRPTPAESAYAELQCLGLFNAILGLLGGGLQSLRLNYVEFFTKFYKGGGKKYNPFGTKRTFTED